MAIYDWQYVLVSLVKVHLTCMPPCCCTFASYMLHAGDLREWQVASVTCH